MIRLLVGSQDMDKTDILFNILYVAPLNPFVNIETCEKKKIYTNIKFYLFIIGEMGKLSYIHHHCTYFGVIEIWRILTREL